MRSDSGASTTQSTDRGAMTRSSAARVCLLLCGLMAVYTGLAALVMRVCFGLVGRGLDMTPARLDQLYGAMWFHALAAAVSAAATLAFRRRTSCAVQWPRFVLLASVLMLVASLDRIAGVLYPPSEPADSIIAPHPTRGWANRVSAYGSGGDVSVRTDRFGHRGPPLPLFKPADERRILFVGDSMTFGCLTPEDETLVARVGALLRARAPGPRTRVINAGVMGYNTWQELDYLRLDGVRTQSDFVVLIYCMNDLVDARHYYGSSRTGAAIEFSFASESHWSGFVRMVRSIQVRRHAERIVSRMSDERRRVPEDPDDRWDTVDEFLRLRSSEDVARSWDAALAALDGFDQCCRESGLPWVLVVFPFREQLAAPDVFGEPQEMLRRWARRRGALYVDLLPEFRRWPAETARGAGALFADSVHVTDEGNRLAAERIAAFLLEQPVLSPE